MSNIKTITDESRAIFEELKLDSFNNLGLAASALNGIPCDVIVAVDGMGGYPLAILITDDIFHMLENPAEYVAFDMEAAAAAGIIQMND